MVWYHWSSHQVSWPSGEHKASSVMIWNLQASVSSLYHSQIRAAYSIMPPLIGLFSQESPHNLLDSRSRTHQTVAPLPAPKCAGNGVERSVGHATFFGFNVPRQNGPQIDLAM